MYKYCLIFFLTQFSFAQLTYVPNDAFEAYLELGGYGYGIPNNNFVLAVEPLQIKGFILNNQNIYDLTDIEDMINLDYLIIRNITATSIDLSNNYNLVNIIIEENQLTSLDVSNNMNLASLKVDGNS